MTRYSAAVCLLWAALTILGAAQQTRIPSTTYSEPPPSPPFSAARAGDKYPLVVYIHGG